MVAVIIKYNWSQSSCISNILIIDTKYQSIIEYILIIISICIQEYYRHYLVVRCLYRLDKMLAYIALPNLVTLLNVQCYPRYSQHKNLVRLGNRIRSIDLYDYYKHYKNRTNMILYLRDGFDRCVLSIEHIEECCYNGLLFEALPNVITKEHADYMISVYNMSLDTTTSSQFRLLLAVMWIYANPHTKEIIRENLGEFFPLLPTHGRTLVEQLNLYNSEQICKLEWTLYDICDIDWGINYELVNILAKNLLTNDNKVLDAFIQLISNNIPIDPKYVYTPQAYEILIALGCYSVDQVINYYSMFRCISRGTYSHKFAAVILCCVDEHNITAARLCSR